MSNEKNIHQLFEDLRSLAPSYEAMMSKPLDEALRDENKALYDQFWEAVNAAIECIDYLLKQGKTINLTIPGSKTHCVRTRGMVESTTMMNYSEKRDSRYCYDGLRLDQVIVVEVVDNQA